MEGIKSGGMAADNAELSRQVANNKKRYAQSSHFNKRNAKQIKRNMEWAQDNMAKRPSQAGSLMSRGGTSRRKNSAGSIDGE